MLPAGPLLPLLPEISQGHSIRVPAPALLAQRLIALKTGTKRRGAAEGLWEGGPRALLAALSCSSQAPHGRHHPRGWLSFTAWRDVAVGCRSGHRVVQSSG